VVIKSITAKSYSCLLQFVVHRQTEQVIVVVVSSDIERSMEECQGALWVGQGAFWAQVDVSEQG